MVGGNHKDTGHSDAGGHSKEGEGKEGGVDKIRNALITPKFVSQKISRFMDRKTTTTSFDLVIGHSYHSHNDSKIPFPLMRPC